MSNPHGPNYAGILWQLENGTMRTTLSSGTVSGGTVNVSMGTARVQELNSAGNFANVGYLAGGGTPLAVNVVAGGVGGGVMQTQVQDSAGNWANAGYVAGGGTPVPVNLVAGVLTGANPSDGTLTQLGTLYYVGNLNMGTVRVQYGTIGVSEGTVTVGNINNIGTLYAGSVVVTSGTLQAVTGLVNGTVGVSMGTLNNVNLLGTLYAGSVCITSGTVTVGDINKIGTLYAGSTVVTSGTLQAVTGLGMGTVRIESGTVPTLGTLYYLSGMGMGTVRVESGTIGVSMGTLNQVNNIGTLHAGSIVVTSGTLDANIRYLTSTDIVSVDHGTIGISAGTVNATLMGSGTVNIASGTVPTLGTLYYLTGMGMGTVRVASGTVGVSAGTVGVIVQSGTLQAVTGLVNGTIGVSAGTLNSVGSASVFSKHDLHAYHSVGTTCTATVGQGTLVQVASKVVYVHHYHAQADGTYGFHFADTKPNGGTLDQGWYFLQREGVTTAFAPYPAYIFKTTTAGSGLCVGTWPSVPCNGTLRLNIVYTDDDAA